MTVTISADSVEPLGDLNDLGGLSDEALEVRELSPLPPLVPEFEPIAVDPTLESPPVAAPAAPAVTDDAVTDDDVTDPVDAKRYNDLRAHANRVQAELDKIRERELQRESFESWDDDEPYDSDRFAQIAGQNPVEAFEYAMESGSDTDALAAIAQVQSDANLLAGAHAQAEAMVAQAQADDEPQAAQAARVQAQDYLAKARNAAAFAEKMRAQYHSANVERQVAPGRDRARFEDLNRLSYQVFSGDNEQYAVRAGELLRDDPSLLGDMSPRAMDRGLKNALRIAQGESGGVPANIDEIVAAKVAEALGVARQGKAAAAPAAQGEPAGRRAPGDGDPLSEADIERKKVFKPQGIGAKAFMDL